MYLFFNSINLSLMRDVRIFGNPMNRKLFLFIFALFSLQCTVHSLELRPLVQASYAPVKITVNKNLDGVLSERRTETNLVFEGGTELIFSAEFATMRYGFGVAYRTPQRDDDEEFVPASIPFWGVVTFGNIRVDRFFSPYLAIRLGSIAPITSNGNWWERPYNFIINPGLGIIFPYSIGLEVNYNYTSMQKSFVDKDLKFRVNSHRVGVQLSIGFELIRDRIYRSEEQRKNKRVFEESYDFDSDSDDDYADYSSGNSTAEEQPAEPAPAPAEEPDPLMSSYPEPTPEPAVSSEPEEDVTIVPIEQVQKKKTTKTTKKQAPKKAPAKKQAPKKTKRTSTKKR